jgi:hypothetical protein
MNSLYPKRGYRIVGKQQTLVNSGFVRCLQRTARGE